LSSFRERQSVVLYFYPTDFSRGCELEARTFAEMYEIFRELDAEVIGISSDSIESHKRFSSVFRLPFPLLSDPDNKIRRFRRRCSL
jgi:peroxiredoxin Q/BCP